MKNLVLIIVLVLCASCHSSSEKDVVSSVVERIEIFQGRVCTKVIMLQNGDILSFPIYEQNTVNHRDKYKLYKQGYVAQPGDTIEYIPDTEIISLKKHK